MKKILLLFSLLAMATAVQAQYSMRRVSVHDPSVVWEPSTSTYYIFGSHRASAYTKDLMNWSAFTAPWKAGTNNNAPNNQAFKTHQTTTVTIGGVETPFGNFDAHAWSSAYGGDYNINGNMWAPDVIWNKSMKKWCMYLSINGPRWNSSIILLTADNIRGPYQYQGPVVFSGFNVSGTAAVSYKNTDLQLVIGQQSSLPSRYNVGNNWGRRWPHCIDPCVFYDEQGQLWMSYGSWSGGIWMLKLNEQNGLRDYDAVYPSTNGNSDGVTSDPYFGKKIAGGYYVSGEASYIEHIGNHYFLFVTNGGLEAAGGYQMRVFRSENPDGPYTDTRGKNAIYTSYVMNYGPSADTRGVNIFGAYGSWGYMADGERSQGHNSIIAAEDGRTYLVYHTRFQNGGEGHQVRVHQVYQNEDGWIVAAPFEYTQEQTKSADIATTQQVATSDIPGIYYLLLHKYGLNHKNMQLATPVKVILGADGSVSGGMSGSWSVSEGTSYVNVKLGNVEFKGVMVMQTMEPTTEQTVALTALASSGVTLWGYKTSEVSADGDCVSGVVAYYNFDAQPIANQYDNTQTATLLKEGSNSLPVLQADGARSGQVLHTYFGAAGNTSHAQLSNPLHGAALAEGATVSFWTNVVDENLWDALFSFYNPQTTARIYMTGNTYVGYNNMAGDWIDLNHSDGFSSNNLNFGSWNFVTLVFSRTEGISLYVDGERKMFQKCAGTLNDKGISAASEFDYNLIVDHLQDSPYFYFGYGSFWGSANALFDELLVHNRPLTASDAKTLYMAETTYKDFASGIFTPHVAMEGTSSSVFAPDGTARTSLVPGLNIVRTANGQWKKVMRK